MKIAVIAGTSEATELIAALPAEDTVTAFAATAYGKKFWRDSTAPCMWDGWTRKGSGRLSAVCMPWLMRPTHLHRK